MCCPNSKSGLAASGLARVLRLAIVTVADEPAARLAGFEVCAVDIRTSTSGWLALGGGQAVITTVRAFPATLGRCVNRISASTAVGLARGGGLTIITIGRTGPAT